MHVSDSAVVSLTGVEEAGHVVRRSCSLLSAQDRWHELLDQGRVLLLVDHVVTHDKIWVSLLAYLDMVQDLGHVSLTNHFVAG